MNAAREKAVCDALCRNNWSGYGTACAGVCTVVYADEGMPCEHATEVWDSDAKEILRALAKAEPKP